MLAQKHIITFSCLFFVLSTQILFSVTNLILDIQKSRYPASSADVEKLDGQIHRIPNQEYARLNHQVTHDLAMILVSPNCFAEVSLSCNQVIELSDVVTHSTLGQRYGLQVYDELGRLLADNKLPQGYSGDVRIVVTDSASGASCESLGRVSEKSSCYIEGTMDTALWCIDDLAKVFLGGSKRPSKGNRIAIDHCSSDTLAVSHVSDYVTSFGCTDTAFQILREWESYTKGGDRCAAFDTIAVIRLPDLRDHLIAPQKDTFYCGSSLRPSCESGVQVVLPNTPYNSTSCETFCIDTGDIATKCLSFSVELETLSKCPEVKKKTLIIKQDCISNHVDTLEDCEIDRFTSGLVRNDSIGKSRFYEIEQWFIDIDTLPPLVANREVNRTFGTSMTSCTGEVELPSILSTDLCNEVETVRATIFPAGFHPWVNYSNGGKGNTWRPVADRTLQLPCGGPYQVIYKYTDNCGNTDTSVFHELYVEDNIPPNTITDDTLVLSLGEKEVWLPATTFDEGSTDNCGIEKILVRRADWLESCGVDVCVEGLSQINSELELERFIAQNGITVGLNDSDLEREYAEQYEWLRDDGNFCDDDGELREMLLEGWKEDIIQHWSAQDCLGQDEHGRSIVDVERKSILGGGWSEEVAFCCEDACSDVVVEVLAIDKGCNFTRGWVVIRVEDKSTVEKAMDFDALTIGCSSYAERYGDLLEAASDGNEEALDQLDELLGGLAVGWRSDDNRLVDYTGEDINKEFSYVTSRCSTEVMERKALDTAHDGEVVWRVVEEDVNVLYEEEEVAEVGGVFVKCGSRVERDVWIELKDCGQGKVTRRWLVYGACGDRTLSGAEMSGAEGIEPDSERPLIFEQVIEVVSDCPLNKASLNLPNDTMICSDLLYDLSGNLLLEVEELSYGLGDLSCRELGIGYEDQILRIVGDADRRKVHRTWTVDDWCSGESLRYLQKIVVDMNCAQAMSGATPQVGEQVTSRTDNDAIDAFQLYQNRPNPFVNQSTIRFRLPEATIARLRLFDAHGRILHAIEKQYTAGLHEETIDLGDIDDGVDGVIYYQLSTETHTTTKSMTIIGKN